MGILFIGMATLIGCSKDAQISKNLWSKGGEWNITTMVDEYNFGGGMQTQKDVYYNCGTYKFNKDGTGTFNAILNGESVTNSFHYSNTATELIITYGNGNLYENGTRFVYVLDWKKDKIKMTNYTGGTGWENIEINLSKK